MAEKAGQAFRKADKDKSGKIEVKELRGALKLLGIDHTKKHVREALAKYDTAQVLADGVKVAADGKLDLTAPGMLKVDSPYAASLILSGAAAFPAARTTTPHSE